MVRIIDGIPLNPIFLILSWVIALAIITIIVRMNPEFETSELVEYASLGAFIFLLQSIPIPIQVIPIILTLSGVPLVITIKGVKRGLVIASSAILLNHLFIPGAISMLPINLTNMLLAGLMAGIVPSWTYKKMGRRVRYLSGFLAGVIYFAAISILIFLEINFFTVSNSAETSQEILLQLFLFGILIIGSLEGLLTAIVSSFYHRTKSEDHPSDLIYEDEDEDEEPEMINFLDEED